jgi:hypothetical protein
MHEAMNVVAITPCFTAISLDMCSANSIHESRKFHAPHLDALRSWFRFNVPPADFDDP